MSPKIDVMESEKISTFGVHLNNASVTGSSWKSPQRGMRQAWHAEPERSNSVGRRFSIQWLASLAWLAWLRSAAESWTKHSTLENEELSQTL
jgi:hypothetical protein